MSDQNLTGNYVIVSPVKDEAAYLEKTIQGVIAQTLRPTRWILVDDGSCDASPQIIARYAEEYPWITKLTLSRDRERKPGSAVIAAFMAGCALLKADAFDFIVKLDCDLEIPANYFETLVARFGADPELGIASGIYFENGKPVKMPTYHAAGCSKMVRARCFEEIGGFIPQRGWDTVDEIRAQSMGWKTCHFADLALGHLKLEGTGIGFRRTNVMLGQIYYSTGGGTLFLLLKCLHRMFSGKPFFLGGVAMLGGYLAAWWKREPKLVSASEAARYRRLLNQRMFSAWPDAWQRLLPGRKSVGWS
jgi:poly-beta-1,6-N-acetyl-D-glucosamine synthase